VQDPEFKSSTAPKCSFSWLLPICASSICSEVGLGMKTGNVKGLTRQAGTEARMHLPWRSESSALTNTESNHHAPSTGYMEAHAGVWKTTHSELPCRLTELCTLLSSASAPYEVLPTA
jgi:hypothetical protein